VLEPDEGVRERMEEEEEGGGGGRPTARRLVGTWSPPGYRTSSSFTTALQKRKNCLNISLRLIKFKNREVFTDVCSKQCCRSRYARTQNLMSNPGPELDIFESTILVLVLNNPISTGTGTVFTVFVRTKLIFSFNSHCSSLSYRQCCGYGRCVSGSDF
jgi:hypothetical protein